MTAYSVELLKDVEEFIKALPTKAQDKVLFRLDQLQKHGLKLCQLSRDIIEKIDKNLYALRIKTRDFFCRIFFTFKQSVIWLIFAFPKKSNKIPGNVIKLAKTRQKDLGC